VTSELELRQDTAEELFEDAPCSYLATRLDGTIVRVNRTFERWTGRSRDELVGRVRLQELFAPGGRIYYETHYAPLLQMQGSVREIAVELVHADGSLLPALVNAVLREDEDGRPLLIRTTIFDASERRRYEQELLRATRREREIAQQLQRSLLSGELPEAPGLELAVAYAPVERGTEVGGDWYDAFWIDEGRRIALVVGDVVGRGIEASAVMGQLRSATRALAATGMHPASLLTALDEYARRHAVGAMSTLVYAELTLATGELCLASAGHPPPLVRDSEGAVTFVWEGRSPPLDATLGLVARNDAKLQLPARATLVLYTDGLVEHPSRPLDDGMERLAAELAGDGGGDLAAFTQTAVRSLDEQLDDVCLVAVRLSGP
jgi:PAS domain S-box-containing protein